MANLDLSQLDAQRLARCLEALLDLSLSAGTVLHPEEHARQALDRMIKLMHAERGLIFLGDESDLKLAAWHGTSEDDLEYPHSSSIVREVVRDRQPILTTDAMQDPRFKQSTSVTVGSLRSIMAAPLMASNRVVGAIYLDNRLKTGTFSEVDLTVVCAVGNHIAHALETARAAQLEIKLQGEQRQRELADVLRETTLAVSSTLEPTEVVDRLREGLARVVSFETSSVQLGEAPSDLGMRNGSLSIPLRVGENPLGVLTLHRPTDFGANELQVARAFASQAGIALENAHLFARMRELAVTDQLTGVFNRHHLLVLVEQAFKNSLRTGERISALMIDIDHFKRFNDTHGHLVGDQVVREVAQRCRQTLRDRDLFGRFGGEEFVAFLIDTPLEGARQTAERLGEAVRGRAFTDGLKVTMSLGISTWKPGEDVQTLISRADEALYAAKSAGRDCYRWSE